MYSFSPQDDAIILQYVQQYGEADFAKPASEKLNKTTKIVKERYKLHLSQKSQDTVPWSPQEDSLLLTKQQTHGSKWDLILKYFPNRSINSIKNHFQYLIQKIPTDREEKLLEDVIPLFD